MKRFGIFIMFFSMLIGSDSMPFTIPTIELNKRTDLQTIVDQEDGIYLGHPSTVLLEDGNTILIVYPKGHGKGEIIYKRSEDGGKTWSDRLLVPPNWFSSKEVPTIHRVIDEKGLKRLILWSGLYPARLAVSEDNGATWSGLRPLGYWGGIVVMGSVVDLKTPGHYLAMFHDDGRFFTKDGKWNGIFTLYQTTSTDGGLTWSHPNPIYQNNKIHLCEPGIIRSPDGHQLAALLRENSRTKNSHVIFSNDEGVSWSTPVELPRELTGDRHTGKYLKDGRLFLSSLDTAPNSPTQGDWVAWVGTYEDIVSGKTGEFRIRIKDNKHQWDCAYPGVEILPNGEIVTITYGHWDEGKSPYILSVRININNLK